MAESNIVTLYVSNCNQLKSDNYHMRISTSGLYA